MESIFSKIVDGQIPAHKVAETLEYLAFLDINPLTEGHLLVIPKKEVDYLFDLDSETYAGLMMFAQIVAFGLKRAIPCERIGLTVIGLEVPHAHVHLIPLNEMDEMRFKNKVSMTTEEFQVLAKQIQANL